MVKDQFAGMPHWLKIAATGSTITIVCFLAVALVWNLVSRQDASVAIYERILDKFSKTLESRDTQFERTLESHDTRQREWMRAHGDRIREENEKTRAVMIDNNMKTVQAIAEMTIQQDRSHMDIAKAMESQTVILKKILDEKRMP